MLKMRFVGMTPYTSAIIQEYFNGKWNQRLIKFEDLADYMKTEWKMLFIEYVKYREENENNEYCDDILSYFYHYGETSEMKRKGEAFIFEK